MLIETVDEALAYFNQNKVESDAVSVECKFGLGTGWFEELRITIKSPKLKYTKYNYREGGTSVLTGKETVDVLVQHFPFTSDRKLIYGTPKIALDFLLEIIQELASGEEVFLQDQISQDVLRNRGIISY